MNEDVQGTVSLKDLVFEICMTVFIVIVIGLFLYHDYLKKYPATKDKIVSSTQRSFETNNIPEPGMSEKLKKDLDKRFERIILEAEVGDFVVIAISGFATRVFVVTSANHKDSLVISPELYSPTKDSHEFLAWISVKACELYKYNFFHISKKNSPVEWGEWNRRVAELQTLE